MAKVLVIPELWGNVSILNKAEKAARKGEVDTVLFLGNYLSKDLDRKSLSAISRKIKHFKDNYKCRFVEGDFDAIFLYENDYYKEFSKKLDLVLYVELDGVMYSSTGFLRDEYSNYGPVVGAFEALVEILKICEDDDDATRAKKEGLLKNLPRNQVVGSLSTREIMTRHLALEDIPEDAADNFEPDTMAVTAVNVFDIDPKTGNQVGKNQFAIVQDGKISILDI